MLGDRLHDSVRSNVASLYLQFISQHPTENYEELFQVAAFIATCSHESNLAYYEGKLNDMELIEKLKQLLFQRKASTPIELLSELPTPIRKIEQGAFSKVYTGEYQGKYVAVKFYDNLDKPERVVNLYNEIEIVKRLQHKNVVRLLAYSPQGFVMERYYTDLFGVIESANYDQPMLKFMIKQLVDGLLYIHSHSIIHRDIKPENILVRHNGELAYADFGLSVYLEKGKTLTQTAGTLTVAAPEILLGMEYNEKVDYWSLGITIFCLIEKVFPFSEREYTVENMLRVIFGSIKSATTEELLQREFSFKLNNPKYRTFLSSLLEVNPEKRKLKRL